MLLLALYLNLTVINYTSVFCFAVLFTIFFLVNLLPYMAISGSCYSAANKDMFSKIWTNGDTITRLSRKHCGKRRNCLLRAVSPFPTMFSKAACC